MIRDSVRYIVNFSVVTGKKVETLSVPEGTTLKDLLNELVERYGPSFRKELFDSQADVVEPHVLVLVNGRSVDQLKKGLDTILSYGDSVILTFPISGG